MCLPHLNSGLSFPSCGHPRAQDLKQAQVGEEGDQAPRGDSGGTGGLAAQVSPEPLLAAGAMSALSPARSSFRNCVLAPLPRVAAAAGVSPLPELQQQHLTCVPVLLLPDGSITTSGALDP